MGSPKESMSCRWMTSWFHSEKFMINLCSIPTHLSLSNLNRSPNYLNKITSNPYNPSTYLTYKLFTRSSPHVSLFFPKKNTPKPATPTPTADAESRRLLLGHLSGGQVSSLEGGAIVLHLPWKRFAEFCSDHRKNHRKNHRNHRKTIEKLFFFLWRNWLFVVELLCLWCFLVGSGFVLALEA